MVVTPLVTLFCAAQLVVRPLTWTILYFSPFKSSPWSSHSRGWSTWRPSPYCFSTRNTMHSLLLRRLVLTLKVCSERRRIGIVCRTRVYTREINTHDDAGMIRHIAKTYLKVLRNCNAETNLQRKEKDADLHCFLTFARVGGNVLIRK